jgi:hypothetical protein
VRAMGKHCCWHLRTVAFSRASYLTVFHLRPDIHMEPEAGSAGRIGSKEVLRGDLYHGLPGGVQIHAWREGNHFEVSLVVKGRRRT